MIQAIIKRKIKRINGYVISGHAESGEYGHDVVCAAVSVLGITTANNLYKLAMVKPVAEMKEGYLSVGIPLTLSKRQEEVSQMLLLAFQYALQEVAEEYNDYIEMTIEK